ncbi:hypothetical protein PG987_001500 [Apiospora arundinis]
METPKRKRARLACQTCRLRKRKCDGHDPCKMCSDFGYDCHYQVRQLSSSQSPALPASALPHPATRPPALPHTVAVPGQGPSAGVSPSTHDGLRRRVEANSGATTVRRLGLKMDPTRAPRLNLFGWNIGSRNLSSNIPTTTVIPITDITSLDHMKVLAQVYFDKLDPCYGFIDKQQFFLRLESRWESGSESNVYDSVLGGVAALGCLFSQRNATATELHLVQSARSILDAYIFSGSVSIDLLTGWLLRTVHLRLTDSPHATWIASSTLMHLIEALGLHSNGESDSAPGDYTAELIGLLPTSFSLDPSIAAEETDLVLTLSTILNGSHTQPPSVMAQTNLVLCMVRRILSQNLDMSSLADQVLALLRKALGCARSMVQDCTPWHQVANVPFHIICVLLIMDTRSSLGLLPEAIQTLGFVASTYDTETMREAKSTAYLLVLLHQQRRKDDLAVFSKALFDNQPDTRIELPSQTHPDVNNSEDHAWLEALVADLPSLRDTDLDEFLNTDMMGGSPFFLGA